MKKLFFLTLAAVSLLMYSCDDRLEELNTDSINPAEVDPETLFTRGMVETFNNMVTPSVGSNPFKLYGQYWSQTTYPEESQYNLATRAIPQGFWTNVYRDVLIDLKDAKGQILVQIENTTATNTARLAQLNNQIATIDILRAYNYSTLVDVFGNVPFSEALDPENLTPKYDDASTIYDNVRTMLDGAIDGVNVNYGSFSGNQDPLYGGNMGSWVKFANTLKLRLGMRLADANEAKSKSIVNDAISGGVFESNADNASLDYMSAAPNTNPVYAALVLSGRNDYVISNTLDSALNSLQDPRLFRFSAGPVGFPFPLDDNDVAMDSTISYGVFAFYQNVDGEDSVDYYAPAGTTFEGQYEGRLRVYKGGTYGTANSYGLNSKISSQLTSNPQYPGTILSYVEVEFLLAEAAARGGYTVTGTAEEHYNAGIEASFDQWGASGYDDYILQPEVAYATAQGDWRQKIGSQLWIGLFNQGFESWNTWKRLDFEGLKPLPGQNELTIPYRFFYPLEEAQLNGTSVSEAASAIGGDKVTTKIFWDVN